MRPAFHLRSFTALTLWALFCGVGPAQPAAPPAPTDADSVATTVIVVRHAEKLAGGAWLGADPPLSTAGTLRARELARLLGDADVRAIYVTPWKRNRETAQPLASRRGDSLIVVDPVDETVRRVRRHHGETVLVVGHSNTIPRILRELTGLPVSDSLEVRYDDLWVVTLVPGRPAGMLKLRYGAPSAPAP